MLQTGQCFIFHFPQRRVKGYFFTGIVDDGDLVMCEMVPAHKMDPVASFWKMSETFFNENMQRGTIELI